MLREIHHRVKNNLQVIASLLNLQAAEGADASAREALLEGRRRVLAMALVHDELYDDPDLASIALDAFIDRFVAGFDPEDAPPTIVRKIVRVEPWPLDIEKAVPLGLILSEALSNAYRHAFSAGIAGKIEVEARRGSDGGLVVEVADNGKGLPPPASLRRGLGLALIDALASQLGGKAEILGREEGGTLVRLSMPPSPSSPAPSPGACP
jgi:two-component sensor histidine kinase